MLLCDIRFAAGFEFRREQIFANMEISSSTTMLLDIPVHDEAGWTDAPRQCPAQLIARLSEHTKKAPEQLKKNEESAALLRTVHLDVVTARARRANERAIEVKARRLRIEANTKQVLLQRLHATAERAARHEQTKLEREFDKALQRHALVTAVKAVRSASKASSDRHHQHNYGRVALATSNRQRRLKELQERNAVAVRRSLTIAAAVKEQEKEASIIMSAQLTLRLNEAAGRRLVELHKSPRTDERARVMLASQAVDRAFKRRSLEKALANAATRRDALLSTVRERASANNAKAAAAADERKAIRDETANARRNLFEKLNSAAVSREISQRRQGHKKGELIEIEMPAKDLAPAALVARLSQWPTSAQSSANRQLAASRQLAATERRLLALVAQSKPALRDLARVKDGIARVAAREAKHVQAIAARHARSAAALARLRQARITATEEVNRRVAQAELRRRTALAAKKQALRRSLLKHTVATARHAARLLEKAGPHAERSAAAAACRTVDELTILLRGEKAERRRESVASRHATLLAARVARARQRATPIAFTTSEVELGVEVQLLTNRNK